MGQTIELLESISIETSCLHCTTKTLQHIKLRVPKAQTESCSTNLVDGMSGLGHPSPCLNAYPWPVWYDTWNRLRSSKLSSRPQQDYKTYTISAICIVLAYAHLKAERFEIVKLTVDLCRSAGQAQRRRIAVVDQSYLRDPAISRE